MVLVVVSLHPVFKTGMLMSLKYQSDADLHTTFVSRIYLYYNYRLSIQLKIGLQKHILR